MFSVRGMQVIGAAAAIYLSGQRILLVQDIEMDSPPGHDLETWERFQLDADGQGTTNAKKKLAETNNMFREYYFGGVQARKKWGYLIWEVDWVEDDGSTTPAEAALLSGRNIFKRDWEMEEDLDGGVGVEDWAMESARQKYGHLLNKTGRPLEDNSETWEWLHCPDGDTSTLEARLADGLALFQPWYFGGVQAWRKYG